MERLIRFRRLTSASIFESLKGVTVAPSARASKMLAVQLKSALTVFGGKGASGFPRVAFELEARASEGGREGGAISPGQDIGVIALACRQTSRCPTFGDESGLYRTIAIHLREGQATPLAPHCITQRLARNSCCRSYHRISSIESPRRNAAVPYVLFPPYFPRTKHANTPPSRSPTVCGFTEWRSSSAISRSFTRA